MKPIYVFMVLLAVFAFVDAEDHFVSLVDLNKSKVYCGHVLTSELSFVCKGKYNALKVLRKKSLRYTNVEDNVLHIPDTKFITKRSATSIIKSRRRLIRGVVNECCMKPCTQSELKFYCAQQEGYDDQ